ncbi:MAG: hypothetical protein VB861_17890, partial [Planctomycetaceae bacterium]
KDRLNMTVGRNGETTMTDQLTTSQVTVEQVWTDPQRGAALTEGPWAELASAFDALDPETPTIAAPGSMEKVMMLQARYSAGVPLWDERDSYDHSESAAAATPAVVGASSEVVEAVEEQGEPLAI